MNRLKHPIVYMAFASMLGASLHAQWTVKTKKIRIGSKDRHVTLDIDFPVLTGNKSPTIRKLINKDLGKTSRVDQLILEVKSEIKTHESKSISPNFESEEDYPWSYDMSYSLGLNTKEITSIGINIYYREGGAVTGHSEFIGRTYSNISGKIISLNDIFIDGYDEKFIDLFFKHLASKSDQLFPEWKMNIKDIAYDYYLDNDNIIFVFPKYSLGPGAMGCIHVEVPFKELKIFIKPSGPLARYVDR